MLLGDGCLKTKKYSNKRHYEFVVSHSTKQQAYIEYKKKLFHSIMGGREINLSYGSHTINGVEYYSVRFSRMHKAFRLFHKVLYCNNDKKYFSRKVLDYLNPQALALWYMDDGTLSKNKKKGKITSCEMRICTYVTEEEVDTIVTYFHEVWGITAKKRRCKEHQWIVVFNTVESKKFELLIKDYIIPEMMYKLPSLWVTRVPDNSI